MRRRLVCCLAAEKQRCLHRQMIILVADFCVRYRCLGYPLLLPPNIAAKRPLCAESRLLCGCCAATLDPSLAVLKLLQAVPCR